MAKNKTSKSSRLLQEQKVNNKADIEYVGDKTTLTTGFRMKEVGMDDILALTAFACGLWVFLSYTVGYLAGKI